MPPVQRYNHVPKALDEAGFAEEDYPSYHMTHGATAQEIVCPWGDLETKLLPGALQGWENDMVGRGYLAQAGTGQVKRSMLQQKAEAKTCRDDMVMRTITRYMFEFAYNPDEPRDIYIRRRESPDLFRKISPDAKEIRDEVTDLYEMFFGRTPHSETEACFKNIMDNIRKPADLDNGIWYMGQDVFWDSKELAIIPAEALSNQKSYREIGSTSRTPGVDMMTTQASFNRWDEMLQRLTMEKGDFDKFYRDLPMDYDYLKTWAHPGSLGYQDKYWDLAIAVSTIFMYEQPPIAYMEQGNPRGGKSTFNQHLHFLVGPWQTTRVDLPGLADWSFNNALFGSLLNAPDEDPAQQLTAKQTAAFKSLAAKEEYDVPVKNSAISKRVKPKFMMFIPKNSPPSFGADSDACMTRLRFIFFTNDLSKMDHKPKDFIKETFVDDPDLLSEYVGFILALTKYFSKRGMWYSPTMLSSSNFVAETVNSTRLYYNMWRKFYVGYESFPILWQDYQNFCIARGYEKESKDVLRQRFMNESQNDTKKYYPDAKKEIRMCIGTETYNKEMYKQGLRILCRADYIENIGRAEDQVLNGSMSFVDIRNKKYEDKMWGASNSGGQEEMDFGGEA